MRMDPTAFRAQLLQNFRVKLGPGELGAIFTEFDRDRSQMIDGTEVPDCVWRFCGQDDGFGLSVATTIMTRILDNVTLLPCSMYVLDFNTSREASREGD